MNLMRLIYKFILHHQSIIIIWQIVSVTNLTYNGYRKTWDMVPTYRHIARNRDVSNMRKINIMDFIQQQNNASQISEEINRNTKRNNITRDETYNNNNNNNSTVTNNTSTLKIANNSNNNPPIGHLQYGGGGGGQIFLPESDYGSRVNPNNNNIPSSQFPHPLPPICDHSDDEPNNGRVCPSADTTPENGSDQSNRRNSLIPGSFNSVPTLGTYPGSGIPFQRGNARPYGGTQGPHSGQHPLLGSGGAGSTEPGGIQPTYGYGTNNGQQPPNGTPFPQPNYNSQGSIGPHDNTENKHWNRGNTYPSQRGLRPFGGNEVPATIPGDANNRRVPQNGNNGVGIIRPNTSGTGVYIPTYNGPYDNRGNQPGTTTTYNTGTALSGNGPIFGSGKSGSAFDEGKQQHGTELTFGSGQPTHGNRPIFNNGQPTHQGPIHSSGQPSYERPTYGNEQPTHRTIPNGGGQSAHGTRPTLEPNYGNIPISHGIGPSINDGRHPTYGREPTLHGTGQTGSGPTLFGTGQIGGRDIPQQPQIPSRGTGQTGSGPTLFGTGQVAGHNIPQQVPSRGIGPNFPRDFNNAANPQTGRPGFQPDDNIPGNINPNNFGNTNGQTNPNFPNNQFTPFSTSGRGQGKLPSSGEIPQGAHGNFGGTTPGQARRPNWSGDNNSCIDENSIITNTCTNEYNPTTRESFIPWNNPSVFNNRNVPTSDGKQPASGGTNRSPSHRGNGFRNTNRHRGPNELPENRGTGRHDTGYNNIPQDGFSNRPNDNEPPITGNIPREGNPFWSQGGIGTGTRGTGKEGRINPYDYDDRNISNKYNPNDSNGHRSSGRHDGPHRRPNIGTNSNGVNFSGEENYFGHRDRIRPGTGTSDGRKDVSDEENQFGHGGRRGHKFGIDDDDIFGEEDYFKHNGRRKKKPAFGNDKSDDDTSDDETSDHEEDENYNPGEEHNRHIPQNGHTPHKGHGHRKKPHIKSKGRRNGWKNKKKYGLNDDWFTKEHDFDHHNHDPSGKCHSDEDNDWSHEDLVESRRIK